VYGVSMNKMRLWPVVLAASLLVSACGGGGAGDQTPRVHYGKLVSFGDSLSDVGSYAVSGIAAMGGGKFTVNGTGDDIWIEMLAAQLELSAPCAAQTGLNAVEAAVGFPAVAVENHEGCYAYAQGGARVTNPIGPGNVATASAAHPSGYLGALTDPVVNQITRHLALAGGTFASDDLVTVLAGGNDVFWNLRVLAATVAAGGDASSAAQAAVLAMANAGDELVVQVKTRLLANGAKRVVVVNVPDVSITPMGLALDAATRQVVLTMVQAFNAKLNDGLAGLSNVLVVDAFGVTQDQALHPAQYGLSNLTEQACDPDLTPFGALACTSATLISGDVSHYLYADDVHPTPYGSLLLARFVSAQMAKRGWL
jgi:outer membrane lipase/esterase